MMNFHYIDEKKIITYMLYLVKSYQVNSLEVLNPKKLSFFFILFIHISSCSNKSKPILLVG